MTDKACPIAGDIAIIGSTGRMGKMLLKKCGAAGISARGVDLPFAEADLKAALANAEMAILCVPAANLEEIVQKVARHLPPGAILADITSVKEGPMRQMQKYWQGPVVGSHPLFGPNMEPGADLPVCLTPGDNASQADVDKVRDFYQELGCRVFEATAEKHDKAMARIQNMNFITNLAFFAATAGQEDLLPFLTPSFQRRKQAAAKMLNEDAEMFCGLFEANAHSHEAVRKFRKMLNLAAAGDIELLCRLSQWWWRDQDGAGGNG